jgi:hypothetical protein
MKLENLTVKVTGNKVRAMSVGNPLPALLRRNFVKVGLRS